ncbi:MAG: hypothetical protein AB7H66_11040 [Hyphomonadaceae bacterium]
MSSTVITSVAIFVAIALLSFLLAKATPVRRTDEGFAIRPTFIIPAVGLFGFAIAGLCLYGFISSGALPPLILSVGFALLGALLANTLRPVFVISTDKAGIEGPNSLLLTPRRVRIAWDDVTRIVASWTGSLFVEATNGQRTYFNTAYAGHQWLVEEIVRRRPDIQSGVQS